MNEKHTKLTDLLTLLVFTVFALCVLLVLLTGAKAYKGLVRRGEDSYALRTAARYVTTRVQQAQFIEVGDFDGCPCLLLSEDVDGHIYITRVYCYDGSLRELYAGADAAVFPRDGDALLPLEQLDLALSDGVLTAKLADRTTLTLYIRPGQEVPR